MSPAFESCPPGLNIGIGAAVFGVELAEMGALEALKVLEVIKVLEALDVLEGPKGPIITPGSIPGVPIKVNGGHETDGRKRQGRGIPTTGSIRFVEVPIVLILECLECAVSTLSKKKAQQRTVGSRRAQ